MCVDDGWSGNFWAPGGDLERDPEGHSTVLKRNSEFNAIGSGSAGCLTVKNVMQKMLDHKELGEKVKMIIKTDSDAATGMLHRVGCGRVRHLATVYFWHHEALPAGLFEVAACQDNAADLGTKMLDLEAMNRCMNMLNIRSRGAAGFRVDVAQRALAASLLRTSEWT